MGKNRGNGSCQATTSRDRLKFISTRRDSSVTAPTLTVGQVLDGTAQENTSVGKMSRTAPNPPRWCGKHSCLQNWESTQTWARLSRLVTTKKLLPSYKLFLLWVPAGKTGRRWWSWWSERSNFILQKLSITGRGEITGWSHSTRLNRVSLRLYTLP